MPETPTREQLAERVRRATGPADPYADLDLDCGTRAFDSLVASISDPYAEERERKQAILAA